MGKQIVFTAPREVGFLEYEDPPLQRGEVRIATLFSGLSAGTELTAYRGTNVYLAKRWDPDRRLFVPAAKGETSRTYPLSFGYEDVGSVVEVGEGVDDVAEGDVIYGAWAHKTTEVMRADQAREQRFPAELDPLLGIFMGIAPTALNAILDADIHVGETVAVFGEGTVGQIITQLARLNGATVIAVDLMENRLELAQSLGAHRTVNPRETPVAEEIKRITDGRGADVVVEATGAPAALHEAIRACVYSAKVIAVGFHQGGAADLRLGDEFHHNRVNLVSSQIYGVNPRLSYRWDLARLREAIIELLLSERLELHPLVTHVVAFEDAARGVDIADRKLDDVVQVVFEAGD
jgi:2-desacetyl-2-hydroxyethyl bacteriochlorophyllide A dehydrogenase